MRIVFMGSSDFACSSLTSLASSGLTSVAAVVTQPDRPSGRGLEVSASPVRKCADAMGLNILTPEDVNAPQAIDAISAIKPDLIVVVAYGQILKKTVLSLPPMGCINIHGSLLPKYRGAAPIQWVIAQGETLSGVTSMFINERMDAGDIILRKEVPVTPSDTGETLHDKLAQAGALLLVETITAMKAGNAPRQPQDESEATYAPKLNRQSAKLDWTRPADRIANEIRGFNPWPTCWCQLPSGLTLKVLAGRVESGSGKPGEILDVAGDGMLVACGQGSVRLLEVKPEGKKLMSGQAFLSGHQLCKGDLMN